MQAETKIERRPIRRVMLPQTEQMTREVADLEDARRIRFGFSPSYHINLGSLCGNRYTGYAEIFPRTLYKFDWVFPTGINEDPERLEKDDQPAFTTTRRSPRVCAEDVSAEAAERVFLVFHSLTDRGDAQEIWDAIYPVEVEADIWAKTDRAIRGKDAPSYLREYYRQIKLDPPYIVDGGHALKLFIEHLEREAPALIHRAGLTEEQVAVAEVTIEEMLDAATRAYEHRSSRLHTSLGSIESRQNTGIGKKQLDPHDWQCIKETGIERPEDKPVAASQKLGAAMGQAIADRSANAESQLAVAVDRLAEGQAQTNKILEILLAERTQRQTEE